MNLSETTAEIFKSIPEAIVPNAQDAALIYKHKKLFISYENALITGFYDTVYGDDNLKDRLTPEQRKMREQTMRQWYQITTNGNFDQHYWNWQVFVGIVHVKHDIPNAAMLGMWGWMMSFFQRNLLKDLDIEEAIEILAILQKLQAVVSSLTVESFIMTRKEAIRLASGLNDNILGRLVGVEIDKLLTQGRTELMNSCETEQMVA
ncbi:MAG: Globin domain-containing protein [Cocleimonas sp.]|nr:Globin domain-containing protein [Cocleimonas sp.]